MRYQPPTAELFKQNRQRLVEWLPPGTLAVVNANDILPTNADGTLSLIPNSDLFYLSGIEQEESILVLFPDADDEKHREVLFLREPNEMMELWEGHKLTRDEARAISGIQRVHWLSEFPQLFHRWMCECAQVYLNSNEHKRAVIAVETREARFVEATRRQYPLHTYGRLAPLLHRVRVVKSSEEIALMRQACVVTGAGFERVLKHVRPGVHEFDVEAEFAHEFIRNRCRFAYMPIVASGKNACCLHYMENIAPCKKGELLLLDVGASHANYSADMTRTIPVSGKFTPRQRQVYQAVLRVLRASIANLIPGKKPKDWQLEAEALMEKELVDLKLLTLRDIKKQDPDRPAVKQYFMHGLGHPIGLDVHDVGLTTEPIQAGWVMTVEPGIYLPKEGFAVRLENTVQVTADGQVDLMADIPIEPGDIEARMKR